jgi:hypothetical protein
LRAAAFILAAAVLGACTSADPGGLPPTMPTGNERDTEIKHEACDMNAPTASKVDVNGDGRPDIVHVTNGAREVCRVVDLNLDGAIDAFIYYDEAGLERRRESDFDRDGRPDEIVSSRAGSVFLKERETNYDDQLDTWDYYEGGRLVRRERDSDGDALIDQWWGFNDPTDPSCAAVATDRNVDGKPDPENVVDLCAEARAKKAAGPVFPSVVPPAPKTSAAPAPNPAGPPNPAGTSPR